MNPSLLFTSAFAAALIAGLLCATIASAQSPAAAQPEKKPSPIEGAAAIIAAPAVAAAECKLDKLGDCLDAIVENSNAALARLLARVPQLVLPVRPGRNLAIIIEVAARNFSLKHMGYSAAKELDRRLNEMMNQKK